MQRNLQSDSRARRGGLYQLFMYVCVFSSDAAKSLQLPLSSVLNTLPMHHAFALPLSQINLQSDSRAER
eukprot:scaffold92448_cov49-Phaeocystis_antarctica.AAC.3